MRRIKTGLGPIITLGGGQERDMKIITMMGCMWDVVERTGGLSPAHATQAKLSFFTRSINPYRSMGQKHYLAPNRLFYFNGLSCSGQGWAGLF